MGYPFTLLAAASLLLGNSVCRAQEAQATKPNTPSTFRTHPPMRPLPTATPEPLAKGPKLFVDAARGNDVAEGTENQPWRTLRHAVRQLKPGDTLYLRAGIYYETVSLT